ncbi:alkaline shock response membrane anchor protein AmaP [Pseudonocardia nantongensis]|uniref:alkaline shock response membrane anchor protein AmaP n=1 Tax=Pseudonocardia nantongensis TaxID=1181885 RepID=UPI003979D32A
MASANPPARLNRTLLLLLGAVLLVAGAAGLALGLAPVRAVFQALDPAAPLLPPAPDPPGWMPWAATAAAVVVGLLALRWLLAQVRRRPRTRTWTLPSSEVDGRDTGATRMHADHAADALAADIDGYDGVRRAAAVLVGDRTRPQVHLEVTADAGADLAALRTRISEHALPRMREALGIDGDRTDLVLRLATDDANRSRVG